MFVAAIIFTLLLTGYVHGQECELSDTYGRDGTVAYSENANTNYPYCEIWIIRTPEGSKVSSRFRSCQISSRYDSIDIYDGYDSNSTLLERYGSCPSSNDIGYTSSNTMKIHYSSSSNEIFKWSRFRIEYYACGGHVNATTGSITTPHYPSSYIDDNECLWIIRTPQATIILLDFVDFNLKYNIDYVEVGNGDTVGSPDIGIFSNKDKPNQLYHSTSNAIWIKLFAGSKNNGNDFAGFQMDFGSIGGQGGSIYSDQGSILSPRYPIDAYPELQMSYSWTVYTSNTTFINATFSIFDLRYGSDKIAIYDGETENAEALLATYTGRTENVDPFSTLRNIMLVTLNTVGSGAVPSAGNGNFVLDFQAQIQCQSPDEPSDGTIFPHKDLYKPGENVTVECYEGYEVSTNYTHITCQYGGIWSDHLPECKVVECSDPGQPDNGESEGDNLTYGSNVTFHCDEGFQLNGTMVIVCQSDGQWSDDVPVCTIVVCGDPGEPSNGEAEGDEFNYGDNVTFHCSEGYTLNGTQTITCQANGQWSEETPTCLPISCGDPGYPDNGYRSGDDFTYSSEVTFGCDEGYTINGTDTIQCQSDGQWSDDVPNCLLVECGDPDEVENADMTGDSYTYNSTVAYKCHDGYELIDDSVSLIICQANGEWSQYPECIAQPSSDFNASIAIGIGCSGLLLVILVIIAVFCILRRRPSKKKQERENDSVVNTIDNNTYDELDSDVLNNTKNNRNKKHTYVNVNPVFDGSMQNDVMVDESLKRLRGESSTDGANGHVKKSESVAKEGFVVNDIYEDGDVQTIKDGRASNTESRSVTNKTNIPRGVNPNLLVKENDIYESGEDTFHEYAEANDVTGTGDRKYGVSKLGNKTSTGNLPKGFSGENNTAGDTACGFVSNDIYESGCDGDYDNIDDRSYASCAEPNTQTPRPSNDYDYATNGGTEIVSSRGRDNGHEQEYLDLYQGTLHEQGASPAFTDNVLYEQSDDTSHDNDVYYTTINPESDETGFQENVIYEGCDEN